MTSYEKELHYLELDLHLRQLARNNLKDFIPYIRPRYTSTWFQDMVADKLQQVYRRQIQRLMIFMPPQHGKSEVSTRSFPAWVLGKSPETQIVVCSYSAGLSTDFGRDIQNRMDDERYLAVFPETRLNYSPIAKTFDNSTPRRYDIFGVVDHEGLIRTVGVGGGITGKPVDIGIIDDPIKGRAEAQSPTVRNAVWSWYTDDFETRLHNDSAQVVIMTRWHPDDPAGRMLARDGIWSVDNPFGWHVVSLPALRTRDINDYDPRPVGAALWPARHSQAKIEKVRDENPVTLDSLYQQDPKPNREALIFSDWIEIPEFPEHLEEVAFYSGDFGFSKDPAALVKLAVEGKRLYVDELVYETGLTNPAILKRYRDLGLNIRKESYWDGAEPKSIEELRGGAYIEEDGKLVRLDGINAVKFYKPGGSINAGINKLKEYTIYYTARSRWVKHETSNYQWVMNGSEATDTPKSGNDHLMDAIRCGVFTKYGTPPPSYEKRVWKMKRHDDRYFR